METHTAIRKENVQPGVQHVRLVEKKNHWAKMCTNKNDNKKRFAQARTTHNPKRPHEIQNKKGNNRICMMNLDTREPSRLYSEFGQLTFDAVQQQRDNQTEIFTELQIRLSDRSGTHTLKAKVDTGAEGNTLPRRTFRRMFPDKVDELGHPIPGSTKKGAYDSNCIQRLKHSAAWFSVHTVCT